MKPKRLTKKQHAVIMGHKWLVGHIAKRYDDCLRADLEQEGYLGLIRALETFDPQRGLRFSTYAHYWVRSYIGRYVARERAHSHPMDPFSREEVGRKKRAHMRHCVVSLDEFAYACGGQDITRLDALAVDMPTPEDIVATRELAELTRGFIETLCGGNAKLMKAVAQSRFMSEEQSTLLQVGRELGYSREWVRLLQSQLLAAIRDSLGDSPK